MQEQSNPSLAGKVALVTGSSRGVGRAIAQRFASAGATVVLAARSYDKAVVDHGTIAETIAMIEAAGGKALPLVCDLNDRAQAAALIDKCVALAGRIDILCHSAGRPDYIPIAEMSDEIWDETFEVYLRAAFTLARAAIPHMRAQGGGWILHVGSLTAQHIAKPYHPVMQKMGITAYGASKAALARFTTGLACEVFDDNIAVNLIAPSVSVKSPSSERYNTTGRVDEPMEYLTESALQLCYLPAAQRTGYITHSMHFPYQRGFDTYSLDGKTKLPPLSKPVGYHPALDWYNE